MGHLHGSQTHCPKLTGVSTEEMMGDCCATLEDVVVKMTSRILSKKGGIPKELLDRILGTCLQDCTTITNIFLKMRIKLAKEKKQMQKKIKKIL
jgi:hypothetical protein